MTKLFILLTGYLLFGQPTYSVAQKNVQLSNEALLERCCEKIMKVGPCLAFIGDHNGKMRVRLLGIYSHGPILFFMLRLNNRSPFDYAIDDIRFFIFQRGSANASEGDPWQPRSLLPVYVYDRLVTVAGHRRATTIYGLPRFQLPAGARLLIMIRERIPATPTSGQAVTASGQATPTSWQAVTDGPGSLPTDSATSLPKVRPLPRQNSLTPAQGRELRIQTGKFLLQRPRLI
jgi:hypothetical protein